MLNFAEIDINLIIKSKVFPKTTWYIPVFAFRDAFNALAMLIICISNADFGIEFNNFWY